MFLRKILYSRVLNYEEEILFSCCTIQNWISVHFVNFCVKCRHSYLTKASFTYLLVPVILPNCYSMWMDNNTLFWCLNNSIVCLSYCQNKDSKPKLIVIVMLIRRQRAIIANWQILLNVFSSTCSIRLQTKFRMNNYSTNTLCRLNCRWWILGWFSLFDIFFSVLHVVQLFMVLFNKNVRMLKT